MNTRYNYLYRDASNYKYWGSVIFADSEGMSMQERETRVRALLMIDGTFMAHQLQIPELFSFGAGRASDSDHCLHEFDSLEQTAEEANDTLHRTFSQFLSSIKIASQNGWLGFDLTTRQRKVFNFVV